MGRDFQVGPWLVEPDLNAVSQNGTTVRLEPKAMEVLVCLAQHAGVPVSKEKLFQTVWPETFVTDDVLKRCVSMLRRIFEDDAREPRIIQTIPKRGYRLVVPVETVTETTVVRPGSEHPPDSLRATRSPKAWLRGVGISSAFVLVVLAVFSVGGMRERLRRNSGIPPIRSLAVLPLQNLSGDPAQEYFSDGLTDALITDLAQLGSVRVISRTSSMQYKQTRKALSDIARELNVDGIVEGTVQRSGDRVRINVQLIRASSDEHLWANSYEQDLRDVFGLEREVAGGIVSQVRARLAAERGAQLTRPRAVDLKALEAYLQGNYHLQKAAIGIRDSELRKAGEYFQQAIDAEPTFASAYVGLAEAHHLLFWPSNEDFDVMMRSAEKAVALDPTSSDARAEVAVAKYEDRNWSGAEAEYRSAIALNPNSAFAHDGLGSCLNTLGHLEQGWQEKEIAQTLDPNQDHLSHPLYLQGAYDRSIEVLRKRLEAVPEDGDAHYFLALAYEQQGTYRDWVEELGKGMALMGFPQIEPHLRRAFATAGYRGAMRQWATELEGLAAKKEGYVPGMLAQAYAALGDKDRAFYWLEEGIDHPRMAISDPVMDDLKTHPGLAPLRSDPRFAKLLRRYGLPP